jgi:hypothetical protein
MTLDRLVAGDTLDFTDEVPDYPPSDGWTLKYRLIPQFTSPAQTPIELTASTSGETYVVQAAPATTALWAAGTYTWARWVEKTGARQTLDPLVPSLDVIADPSTAAAGYDPRTTAAKIVADLEAALTASAGSNGEIEEYSINGRSVRYRKREDILRDLSYWRTRLFGEEEAERMRQGMGSRRRVYVRFAQP